jgi:hypothetical protein
LQVKRHNTTFSFIHYIAKVKNCKVFSQRKAEKKEKIPHAPRKKDDKKSFLNFLIFFEKNAKKQLTKPFVFSIINELF